MVKMIAQREIYYASKTYRAGECLDMDERDAHLLKLLGHVLPEPDMPKQKSNPQTYRTVALTPEPIPAPVPPPAPPPMTTETAEPLVHSKRKQTQTPKAKKYKRRDMRAAR